MNISYRKCKCNKCGSSKSKHWICLECRQILCYDCDIKIHAQRMFDTHRRHLSGTIFYEESKKDSKFKISYFSLECYQVRLSNDYSMEEQKLALAAFSFLFDRTQKGFPMVLLEDIVDHLMGKGFFKEDREKINMVLKNFYQSKTIFDLTIRKFGFSKNQNYLSLILRNISVEALVWIIQSIKNDCMQPNHNLIHSRIKEYFGIKIHQKDWKKFIEHLIGKMEVRMNKFKKDLKEIKIKKVSQDNYLFYFAVEGPWTYEDFSEVKETDDDYQLYLEFIDKFFRKESEPDGPIYKHLESDYKSNIYQPLPKEKRYAKTGKQSTYQYCCSTQQSQSATRKHSNNNSESDMGYMGSIYDQHQNILKQKDDSSDTWTVNANESNKGYHSDSSSKNSLRMDKSKTSGWVCSVLKPYEKMRSINSTYENTSHKLLESNQITPAIPGGKYGCARMIKHCGPQKLKEKSIGRILALVKKSLDDKILIHSRTLLVKNDQSTKINSSNLESKSIEYKKNIVDLLNEYRGGISLAQFKQYYNKKFYKSTFDFENLGFNKLTEFLKTMDDLIDIKRYPKNNNTVFLKREIDAATEIKKLNLLMTKKNNEKLYSTSVSKERNSKGKLAERQHIANEDKVAQRNNIDPPQSRLWNDKPMKLYNSSLKQGRI